MQYLKADTVTEVLIGPVVAVGDGFTPVTTLTIAAADEAEIIKHGATTVTAITGTLAAITSADGYYALDLVAGDVDTEGRLTILINDDSLCLPVRHDFMVVNANVFDSLFAAATTDYLQVDTIQVAGTAQTAGDLAALITAVDDFVDTEVIAIKTKTDFLPSATAGAAGGLFIAGSNAATTVNITGNLSGSVGSVTGAVGSVTGDVGGNVVGSLGSLVANAINNNSIHSNACAKISDSGIQRGATNWENNSDDRSLAWAISKLVNKVDLNAAGDTLTIRKSNDSTALFTQAVTTSGGASPITALDTA